MPTPLDIVRIVSEQERKVREQQKKQEERKWQEELKRQEEAERNAEKQVVQDVIDAILHEVGYNFKNADSVLTEYENNMSLKFKKCISLYFDKKIALRKVMELHESELEDWLDEQWTILKKDIMVPYKEEAKEYLRQKHCVLFSVYDNVFIDLLASIYMEKNNGKQWLLKTLDNITFAECIQLLKQIKNQLHELSAFNQEIPRLVSSDCKSVICEYMTFYDYAYVLISKKTNELSWNKEKNTYIDENKYNSALLYFYEKDSLNEIMNIIKKETYIKNKNMGNRGEEVVEYALSWLPNKYVNIPQNSVGRYEQKCILIQNPQYRKEAQEYDHIVVGPQGIFLVETKNFAGEITIDEDGNWIRKKEGQGIVGERNPIQQIRRHEKIIKSIVDNVNIVSIMCLSHPKVIVHGAHNSSVKILKSDLLCEYIENYKTEKILSQDEITVIVEQIKRHIV